MVQIVLFEAVAVAITGCRTTNPKISLILIQIIFREIN